MPSGVVAAGHPLTAEAGADALRAGGNAVDAALAAMLTSFVAEPLLTGLGAGGYMLVVARRAASRCCSTSSSRRPGAAPTPSARAPLVAVDVSFGDAIQVFHVGAVLVRHATARRRASARPPSASARCRWPSSRRPPSRSRATACSINAQQAYLFEILAPILDRDARGAGAVLPEGRAAAGGRRAPRPAARRLARAARAPRARRRSTAATSAPPSSERVCRARRHRSRARTWPPTAAEPREPVRVALPRPRRAHQPAAERGRHAARLRARAARARAPARRTRSRSCAAMERAQDERTPEFLDRARPSPASSTLHGQPARLDHAHLGARRRRLGVLGDVHERRGLGHRRPGHRHPRQQHDGRAGPVPARLLHATRPGAGCRR